MAVEFARFEIDERGFVGTTTEGEVLPIEEIVYRGALGETHTHYLREGEPFVAVRKREAKKERTY